MKTQIIKPNTGVNADIHPSLLPANKASWLKNAELGIGKGKSSGVLTPSQSTYTDFDDALLPRIRTWQADFNETSYPFYSYGYTKDAEEFVTQSTFTNDADLDAFMSGLGWTKTATKTYIITTVVIWQYFSWNPTSVGFQNYITCTLLSQGELVGDNLCIGSYYDKRLNQFFWYNYNTAERHNIQLYDANAGAYQTVVETPLLPFDYDSRIGNQTDLVLANTNVDDQSVSTQRLNYFCSETKFPSKINIDRCLSGEYWNNFPLAYKTTDQWLRAVKYPPFQRPTISLETDSTVSQNFITRGIFQFRTRFYYDDGEISTFSPISSLAIPEITQASSPNYILLSNMDAGAAIVTHVEIIYRIGNFGDWRSCQTLKRSDIISNFNYGVGNNTFEYSFYNNRSYGVLDQASADKLFDLHPIQAGGQEFLTNNDLLYNNILEGYDNLPLAEIQKTSITATYGLKSLELSWSAGWEKGGTNAGSFTVELIRSRGGVEVVLDTVTVDSPAGADSGSTGIIYILYDFEVGDTLYLMIRDVVTIGGDFFVFTVDTSSFSGTYDGVTPAGFGSFQVDYTGEQLLTSDDRVVFDFIVNDPQNTFTLNGAPSANATNFDTIPNSSGIGKHLKNGGQYQFGFWYLDEALRSSAVQTWDGIKLSIPHIQDAPTGIKSTNLTFNFNGLVVPDSAKYIVVGRTKNTAINRELGLGFIQWQIFDIRYYKADGTVSASPDSDNVSYIQFKLYNLDKFNEQYFFNTTASYTWTKGDRIQFLATVDSGINEVFFTKVIDVELKSQTSIEFTVDYNSDLSGLSPLSFVEIYTPSAQSPDTSVYYEITNMIPTTGVVGNNQPSVSSVALDTFDTYSILRVIPKDDGFPPNKAYTYESPSAYDTALVPSNGEDIGRPNIVDTTAAQLWKFSLTRFSLAYTPLTFVNGLSTFNSDRLKLYPQTNGKITKVQAINTLIHVFQENKVLKSLVDKQIISLQDGTQQMVAGSKIISDPIDVQGDYGCQDAETFIEKDGVMTYWDLKRGAIVEYDGDSQKPLSRLGLGWWTLQESDLIRRNRGAGIDKIQVHAGFDPKRLKYYATSFKKSDGYIDPSESLLVQTETTVAYHIGADIIAGSYSFIPEYYGYIDAGLYGQYMVSFKQGIPYFHNSELATDYLNFYGTDVVDYIEVVCNLDPDSGTNGFSYGEAIKNFFAVGYNSMLPNSYPSGVIYRGDFVKTSNGMTSIIPEGSFKFKEGYYYSPFFGNTSTGKSHINGEQLKGTYCLVRFKRVPNNDYNEVGNFVFYINRSEKTL